MKSNKIQFKRGDFREYRATTTVRLGKLGFPIEEEDVIEFDGMTLRMGGGEEHEVPALKGAIRSGWIVPIEDENAVYRPRPAGIKVHPADPNSKTNAIMADTDERVEPKVMSTMVQEAVVGSFEDVRRQAAEATAGSHIVDSERPQRRMKTTADHAPPPSEPYDDIPMMMPDVASTDVLLPPPHASRSTMGELRDKEVRVRHTPLPKSRGPQRSSLHPSEEDKQGKGSVGISFGPDEDIVI